MRPGIAYGAAGLTARELSDVVDRLAQLRIHRPHVEDEQPVDERSRPDLGAIVGVTDKVRLAGRADFDFLEDLAVQGDARFTSITAKNRRPLPAAPRGTSPLRCFRPDVGDAGLGHRLSGGKGRAQDEGKLSGSLLDLLVGPIATLVSSGLCNTPAAERESRSVFRHSPGGCSAAACDAKAR
jgi:hypothetical protein